MNYNTDGYNERNIYIHNSNDSNKLKKMGTSNIDSSFAKMKLSENKPDIQTARIDKVQESFPVYNTDNLLIRNNRLNNANVKSNFDNPVSRAMNKNMLKKF